MRPQSFLKGNCGWCVENAHNMSGCRRTRQQELLPRIQVREGGDSSKVATGAMVRGG